MKKFKVALKDANILDTIRFRAPLRNGIDEIEERAAKWARKIIEDDEL
ncbi:MAG: hypothetical protein ACXABO_12890 [Promethearchaeota archaeon]|jgi:hypothetical protein